MGALHVWSNNYIGKYTYIGYIESETQIKTKVYCLSNLAVN